MGTFSAFDRAYGYKKDDKDKLKRSQEAAVQQKQKQVSTAFDRAYSYQKPKPETQPTPQPKPQEEKKGFLEKVKDFGSSVKQQFKKLGESKVVSSVGKLIRTAAVSPAQEELLTRQVIKKEELLPYSQMTLVPALQTRVNEIDQKISKTNNQKAVDKLTKEKQKLQDLIDGKIENPENKEYSIDEYSTELISQQNRAAQGVKATQYVVGDVAVGATRTYAGLVDWESLLLKKVGAEKLSKRTRNFSKNLNQWADLAQPENPEFADQLLQGYGSTAPFFVIGGVVGSASEVLGVVNPKIASWFAAGASGVLEAGTESGSVYSENLDQGKSEEEAIAAADRTFWENVALNIVLERYGIQDRAEENIIMKLIKSASGEGLQEMAQQVISNTNTDKPFDEGIIESGVMGAIVGSGYGSLSLSTDVQQVDDNQLQQMIESSQGKVDAFSRAVQGGLKKAEEGIAAGLEQAKAAFTYKPAENLSEDERDVEDKIGEYLTKNFEEARNRYIQEFGNVLNTDNARELSPDYKSNKALYSAAVHEPSSAFIKELYKEELAKKDPDGNNSVFFTAGGTGAGKTTGISNIEDLNNIQKEAQIVYDTNMNTYQSSRDKIEQALAADKDIEIAFVYRDPVEAFVNGAVPRAVRTGRTVPVSAHIDTHVGVQESLSRLLEDYKGDDRVEFYGVDNSRGLNNAKLVNIEKLLGKRYNKAELESELLSKLQELYDSKQISKDIYEGFRKGATQAAEAEGTPSEDRQDVREESKQPAEGKQPTPEQKQKSEIQSLVKDTLENTQDQEEAVAAVKTLTDGYINATKDEKYRNNLKSLRAELNRQMFELAGATGQGNFKNNYAVLQQARKDPAISDLIDQIESSIADIDKALETAPKPEAQTVTKVTPEPTKPTKPVKSKGPVRQSRSVDRIRERLEESIDKQSTQYNQMSITENAKKAWQFVEQNPERAIRVAKGLEAAPPDVTANLISIAASEYVNKKGDYKLQSEIETARSFRLTRYGQEIVTNRIIDQNSEHYWMQELYKAKLNQVMSRNRWIYAEEKGVKRILKKDTISNAIDQRVKAEKAKVNKEVLSKLESAQSLIDSLTC